MHRQLSKCWFTSVHAEQLQTQAQGKAKMWRRRKMPCPRVTGCQTAMFRPLTEPQCLERRSCLELYLLSTGQ
jgi:hypothetical protein